MKRVNYDDFPRDPRFAELDDTIREADKRERQGKMRDAAFARRRRANGRQWPRAIDASISPDETIVIESDSLRTDGRATLQGSEIVGHSTRESFIRATQGGALPIPPGCESITAGGVPRGNARGLG